MKYTLNTYGWSFECVAKSITDDQLILINEKMDELGYDEIGDLRFELEDVGLDIWDGDLLHITKATNNGKLYFEIIDEKGDKVCDFEINETADLYETIEDYDEKYQYSSHVLVPQYMIPPVNVFVSFDENKGGIFSFNFESDVEPSSSDFTCSTGSIETPDGEWDFIDQIFFKGEPLEVVDYLDNTGKSSTVAIYTTDGDMIN